MKSGDERTVRLHPLYCLQRGMNNVCNFIFITFNFGTLLLKSETSGQDHTEFIMIAYRC